MNNCALGVLGVILGKALRPGFIEPNSVGDFINTSLSPGSYSSYYWEHPVPYIH